MPISNPTAETVFRELDPKQSCRAGTTAALPANTRTANVLTADVNGTLPAQDGVTLVLNERLLVQDEVTGANNGIYDVTDVGSGSTKWTLTRSADFDQDSEVTSGARTFVSEGTANIGKKFTLVTADPITLNTTSLTFDQTGGPGDVVAQTAVDGRSPEERYSGTDVVVAGVAVFAFHARFGGLDGHAISNGEIGHIVPEDRDHTGGFVSDDQGLDHPHGTDPGISVVVKIGGTHAHGLDLDLHFARAGQWHVLVVHPKVTRAVKSQNTH